MVTYAIECSRELSVLFFCLVCSGFLSNDQKAAAELKMNRNEKGEFNV